MAPEPPADARTPEPPDTSGTRERLDHFMARANAAYYATHDPFADFTTAPEISQVFGELLGLWAAVTWRLLGAPSPVRLVEAGPGRGTLMADALRAIGRAAPDFGAAARVALVETSPRLREAQRERLPTAEWHDTIDAVPAGPMILLGNEFLDALPIRQFVRRGDGWTERFVTANRTIEEASDYVPDGAVPDGGIGDGAVVERNEAAEAIARYSRATVPARHRRRAVSRLWSREQRAGRQSAGDLRRPAGGSVWPAG